MQFAATRAEVVSGSVVEVGEWNSGDAHVAGGGRLHRLTDDLGGGGDGNQVEFFAEGADQDGAPESVYCVFCLTVLIEPVLEGLSGVGLSGQCERGECAGDGEFVGGGEE